MIIKFTKPTAPMAPCTVMPLAADSRLEAALQAIAADTGQNAQLLQQDFKAEAGEAHLAYHPGGRLFLLGLGAQPAFADILKAFRSFSHKFRQKLLPHLSLNLKHLPLDDGQAHWLEAMANGLSLGTYQIGRFKQKVDEEKHPLAAADATLEVAANSPPEGPLPTAASRGLAIAATQMRIYDLVNAPSNKKTPGDIAKWAVESGKQYGYKVQVLDKEQIAAAGLQALLAVNQGSEYPPFFIVMEYLPKSSSRKTLHKIGLVGKGVTFDTGGLSIKPSSNMHYMKSDMGGAGAVLGAMEVAAKLQLSAHLIGIIPTTDNCVDAKALKPSDVIGSYSGKTIEVIDTDAEGRLILADGLSYAVRNFQPEILIDLATLTGSTVRTLGYHAAALFSSNDKLAKLIYQSSENCGERVWRLPLWDVYKDDLKSDVADLRNFSGRPMAGAIAAAKFLEAFTDEHPAWAHLDIAGVAFGDSEFTTQKSATAFGVRLLTEFIGQLDAFFS